MLEHHMPPFIIYALPRSRTFWLSKFLTYGNTRCHHDIVTDLYTIKDLKDFFRIPNIGTVETGMVEGWRLAQALVPDANRIVIRRPIRDVADSLAKLGIAWNDDLYRRVKLLDEVSERPGVLTFNYYELENEVTCKKIFEHCLGVPFNPDWWLYMKDQNIQINMAERLEKLEKNRAAINALKSQVLLRVA